MFKIKTEELIVQVLVFIHQAECVLIVIISFISRSDIEEGVGLHSEGFTTKKIIVEGSDGRHFDYIGDARE